jgi:hypothetical protein
MARESKEQNLFDQVMTAFGGYSPGGRVKKDGDRTVYVINRAAAEKSGIEDIDAAVATLNASKLSGGIDEIVLA